MCLLVDICIDLADKDSASVALTPDLTMAATVIITTMVALIIYMHSVDVRGVEGVGGLVAHVP